MQHLVFHNFFLINLYTDLRIFRFVHYLCSAKIFFFLYNNTPNVLTFQHYYMYLFTTRKKKEHVRASNIDCCIRWRLCHRLGVFDIDSRRKCYVAMFLIKGG